MKILFVILDGAADCNRKTPLSKARKPNLDFLASNSFCGLWEAKIPKKYSILSMSEIATLQLLGCYDEPFGKGFRGYLEALGIGLKPQENHVYIRANFATIRGRRIIDRRAGRDEYGLDELANEINKINPNIKFYRSAGHRGVLVFEGSANISDSDLGKKVQRIKAFDKSAEDTANTLNEFLKQVQKTLKNHPINKERKKQANYLLLRGASQARKTKSFERRFHLQAASISGVNIIKGIARFLGMDVLDVLEANGHVDTNLNGKISAAINALEKYDFVLLHINGADECGHDKNFSAKRRFLERIDEEVFSEVVKLKNIIIVVAVDHITSCKTGNHEIGPTPFLLYGSEEGLGGKFDEKSCKCVIENPMEKILSIN